MVDYIPEQGDIVWLTLNPQKGHKQSGRRPAVVLSPSSYNSKIDGPHIETSIRAFIYGVHRLFRCMKRHSRLTPYHVSG